MGWFDAGAWGWDGAVWLPDISWSASFTRRSISASERPAGEVAGVQAGEGSAASARLAVRESRRSMRVTGLPVPVMVLAPARAVVAISLGRSWAPMAAFTLRT